ncbi:hypothetical protein [Sporofaciens sp. SGI.106]|uniref:hypothetical protein n=1 Tax=Sporofaciens sp. SGI.106 TaxID=3420568 RepID=UPI003D05F046
MSYSAQNEKGETAQNETVLMLHRNRKTRWRSHKTPKIQLNSGISGAFSVWQRVS